MFANVPLDIEKQSFSMLQEKEKMELQMPKNLKERLDWLYKNDPVFKAEKDLVDSLKNNLKKEKQKEVNNESSPKMPESKIKPG